MTTDTKLPVIFFPDGKILIDPDLKELADKVGLQTQAGLPFYDVVVIGSGPADQGLAEQREARFALVLGAAAVKDSRTGLIWEQEPDREHDVWSRSNERCRTKTVGGQSGWRGPTIDELKTLIDLSQHDPALSAGHPFTNIKSEIYWTSTPHPTDDIVAWQVSFFSGEPVTDQKSGTRRMWCVLEESGK